MNKLVSQKITVLAFALLLMGMIFSSVESADAALFSTSNIQINAYSGVSTTSNDKSAIVFPGETDTFSGGDSSTAYTPGLGIAYDFVLGPKQQSNYILHDVSVGMNWYYTSANNNGQVLQFGLPQFNNFAYDMDIDSNRLMLDSEWDFKAIPIWHGIIIFGEGGIGTAINKMNYSESILAGGGGRMTLNGNTEASFAYDVGAGVKVPVSKHFVASFRYLYTDLGRAKSSTSTNAAGVVLSQPITADLHNNSFLLGITYLIA